MTEALRNIVHTINKMVSMDSVASCRKARLFIEDALKQNQITHYHAMGLCAMVAHGLCQLSRIDEAVPSEIELGDLRMMELYTIVGRSWKDQEENAQVLLTRLYRLSDQQLEDCITAMCEAFLLLPGRSTRLALLLSLQAELALVVSRYRVDTRLSRDISDREAWTAELADKVELALFETLFYESESEIWEESPEKDNPEEVQATLEGWQRILDGKVGRNDKRDAITDATGRYRYRVIRPGRITLLNDETVRDGIAEYIVPARIDGRRVTRVEHIPDIRCDVLRFEEGIEEIALSGFRGVCRQLVLPDSLVHLREGSFQGVQSLQQVVMNGAVIGEGAFADCSNLESVRLGSKLWSILPRAFENCARLRQVVFPDKIHAICDGAFQNCGIEQLALPQMQTLHDGAFSGCKSLKAIRCTGEIENVRGEPFEGCDGIQSIAVDDGIESLKFEDGSLYYVHVYEISENFLHRGEESNREVFRKRLCGIS